MVGGYLVEYSEKNGERTEMICSQKELVKLLQNPYRYSVWLCRYVNVSECMANHKGIKLRL